MASLTVDLFAGAPLKWAPLLSFRHIGLRVKSSSTLSGVNANVLHPTHSAPQPTGPSDESLMLQYQRGDAGAFDTLYARHRAPLFRFIARQLQQAQRDQAEEVFQEVWMNLIQARETYRVEAMFRTYLYTLAHHRVMDYFRKHRRAEVFLFSDNNSDNNDDILGNLPASRVAEPEVLAISQQQGAAVLRVLGALPAPQREAFLLSEEAGLTIEEIAETTGVSFEAAKSRVRYAFSKMREGLQAYL
jgi:RNA polymerase sigma factor (sigma-70 family)